MSKQVSFRKGTTTEHQTFVGVEGEVTVDTTKDTAVVHDGVKQGGHPLAKESDLVNYYPKTETYNRTEVDTKIANVDMGDITRHKILYVDKGGDDVGGTGSINNPFATIQKAINSATGGSTIVIGNGVYVEDLLVDKTIVMLGHGAGKDGPITIDGALAITGAEYCRFGQIQFRNNLATDVTVSIVDGGNHRFHSCKIEQKDGGKAISVTGTLVNPINFHDTYTVGNVDLDFTSASGTHVSFSGSGSTSMNVTTRQEMTIVAIENTANVGTINHIQGRVLLRNVREVKKDINGDSIVSTAPVGLYGTNGIFLESVGLQQEADFSYGKFNKTGDCVFTVADVNRDEALDVLTGQRLGFARRSIDLGVGFTPVNYTPVDNSVEEHLKAIDVKLGELSI